MFTQTVEYSYNGKLLSNKKEQITYICNNMEEFQNTNAKWNKPEAKRPYTV